MRIVRYFLRNWLIILAALVSGGILHVVAVLATPRIATESAFEVISQLSPVNEMLVLPPVTPDEQPLPFMAADVRYAVCRFDLAAGPVSVRMPLADKSWTISLYNQFGENYYTLAAGDLQRPDVEIILAPAELTASAPIPFGRDAGASAITVSVGEAEGLLMIRAPIRGNSFLGENERALAQARCEVKEDEQPLAADAAAPE